jgi:hypothetical protein
MESNGLGHDEIAGADLANCLGPLADDERRALRRYWDQVIREEWIPAERQAPRLVPLPELDERRERRRARRAFSLIAGAARRGSPTVRPAEGGEAA